MVDAARSEGSGGVNGDRECVEGETFLADMEAEPLGHGSDVAFDRHEEATALAVGIGRDTVHDACRRHEVERTGGAIQGVRRSPLVEVVDREDGGPCLGGDVRQRREQAAHLCGLV